MGGSGGRHLRVALLVEEVQHRHEVNVDLAVQRPLHLGHLGRRGLLLVFIRLRWGVHLHRKFALLLRPRRWLATRTIVRGREKAHRSRQELEQSVLLGPIALKHLLRRRRDDAAEPGSRVRGGGAVRVAPRWCKAPGRVFHLSSSLGRCDTRDLRARYMSRGSLFLADSSISAAIFIVSARGAGVGSAKIRECISPTYQFQGVIDGLLLLFLRHDG